MGQYHKPVNVTACEYLSPHHLGAGLKAWEMLAGGVPAALAALLSYQPGNTPADLGHHVMTGRWAGHKLLIIGDYAEPGDTPGIPTEEIYGLCGDMAPPVLEDYRYANVTLTESKKRLAEGMREYNKCMKRLNALGLHAYAEIAGSMYGLVEEALSCRFIGDDGWKTQAPVKARAERDVDGKPHYELRLPKGKKEADEMRDYIMRMCSFKAGNRQGGDIQYPEALGLERWPWDRPPANLAWDNILEGQVDQGQHRVFANLSRREFIDPATFGEVPTTAGIMRASDNTGPARMTMDMIISNGGIQSNVKKGAPPIGSASALLAMLLHPEARGGGDIEPDEFPELGRWRGDNLVLTSEREGEFPTTVEAKASFTDISGQVIQALALMTA